MTTNLEESSWEMAPRSEPGREIVIKGGFSIRDLQLSVAMLL